MTGSSDYGTEPSLVIVGDHPDAVAAAQSAAAAAGLRVARVLAFAEVAELLSQQALVDAIVVETRGIDDGLAEGALSRIDAVARDRDVGIVVALDDDQIDLVAAQIDHRDAQLLCGPSIADRVAALSAIRFAGASGVRDSTIGEAERLRMLNAEVARIAETLAQLTRAEGEPRAALREAPLRFGVEAAAPAAPVEAGEVRGTIRARRLRANHFPTDLFADPAWDMLLDLFAADLEHRRVSVSSLCIAAAVPGTTALRWIGTMVDAGLFERQADPFDRRRAFIALSDRARDGMRRYFEGVRRAGLAGA